MAAPFVVGKDTQGTTTWGLDIINNRSERVSLAAGTQARIVLQDADVTAIFFPLLGANYRVGPQQITAVPANTFESVIGGQNVAEVSIPTNWPEDDSNPGEKSLYVYAVDPLDIYVLIGQRLSHV